MVYNYYQLRTKKGDEEIGYFMEYQASYLESINNHIKENELDIKNYILIKVEAIETDVSYLIGG